MDRPSSEIWAETMRTAELIRGYRPSLERLEQRVATQEFTSQDMRLLVEVAWDAESLASLIEELQRRGATVA